LAFVADFGTQNFNLKTNLIWKTKLQQFTKTAMTLTACYLLCLSLMIGGLNVVKKRIGKQKTLSEEVITMKSLITVKLDVGIWSLIGIADNG
jgi:hypothetical protein